MSKIQQRRPFVLSTGQENFNAQPHAHMDHSNFQFRQRTLGLDWRKVAGIDCDEIRDSGNVELLQELIFTITFCNVDAEFAHSAVTDKNLLKLFKTSQLIIEYLIHCQDCLLTTVNKNSQELLLLREEVATLQKKLSESEEMLKKVKRECHKRRVLAAQFQAELMALKSGSVPREQYPCAQCPKIFLSSYFLKLHMAKRHNVEAPPSKPTGEALPQVVQVKVVEQVVVSKEPLAVVPVAPLPESEVKHKEEIDQLRSFFTRELTEMSEKMAEWQRLAEQLRTQRDVAVQNRGSSPTPAAPQSAPPIKPSNFGAKLEDDLTADQEKRILEQLGSQLNHQFVSFAGQLDERVLQMSRGIADQLATDSRRHTDVLTTQVSNLMAQLAKEREARQIAERRRDEALIARQSVTYIQPPQKSAKQPLLKASTSTPSLAAPPVPVPVAAPTQIFMPPGVEGKQAKSPAITETKHKKSFFETLSQKFKSPKKATSTPSLAQQQLPVEQSSKHAEPQRQEASTLPRSSTVGQNVPVIHTVGSQSANMSRPDFFPSGAAPALPKFSQQSQKPSDQPFLVALMEDSTIKDSESELTSRPSSTSPQNAASGVQSGNEAVSPRPKWSSAEPVPVGINKAPAPSVDTLQASMTLPTFSATNLASTGPAVSTGQIAGTTLPNETAGSSMYLSVTATSTDAASGLVMARPHSAEFGDDSVTPTDLDRNIRRQMVDLVNKELEKRGVKKGQQRLDADLYAELRAQLENERRDRDYTYPDFYSKTRNQILTTIDKLARDRMAGGSTYRSDMSRTESSYHPRVTQANPTAVKGLPVSANATPRGTDRSEMLPTDSQWTSEEDTLEFKTPAHQRHTNLPVPVIPAQVAAASSTAVVISSTTANVPVLRKSESPAAMHFTNPTGPSPVGGRQPQPGLRPQMRTEGATSPSGTTDDVSTLDVTSSIRDHPTREGAAASSANDFDETDSDEQILKREMARYGIDSSVPDMSSPNRKPGVFHHQSMPTFGRGAQNISGSRPASSLTGISDEDLGP